MTARRLAIAAAVLIVVPLLAWCAWFLHAEARLDAAVARWEAERGPLDDALFRFPESDSNDTALELERAAARLGIDLVPPAPGMPMRSTSRRDLSEYLAAQAGSPTPGAAPPSPEAQAFLDAHAGTLDAIVDILESSPPPRWPMLLGDPLRFPNVWGHAALQEVLAAAALQDVHRGDPHRAARLARTSVRLGDALASRPEPGVAWQVALTRGHALAVVRGLPRGFEPWIELPASSRDAVRESLDAEAWQVANLSRDAGSIARFARDGLELPAFRTRFGTPIAVLASPLMRADATAMLDLARTNLANAASADPCPHAPPLPLLGRRDWYPWIPDFSARTLVAAAAADFDVELTRVIIEARATRRTGQVPGSCSQWRFRVEELADGRLQVTTLGRPPRGIGPVRLATTWVERMP